MSGFSYRVILIGWFATYLDLVLADTLDWDIFITQVTFAMEPDCLHGLFGCLFDWRCDHGINFGEGVMGMVGFE